MYPHVFYERYYYPADKKVIYDTTYQFPSAGYPYYAFVEKLHLDEEGRIDTDTLYYRDAPTVPYPQDPFQYDANGNVIRTGFAYYDDKVNIYRTNKWFMLAYRDYSRNNPIFLNSGSGTPEQILQYNAFDLPAIVKYWSGFFTIFTYYDGLGQIRYTCDAPSGPGHGY